MPVEHEFKFVLKNEKELYENLKNEALPSHVEFQHMCDIHQFYLSHNARIRHDKNSGYQPIFTYKQFITGQLLEIETEITPTDLDIAKKGAIAELRKHRFVLYDHDGAGLKIEVDFLFDESNEIYFAMMEIETHPAVIHLAPPDFIAPYVILSVPREHNAYFSNRLLADPEYARTVMENYLKERE